MLPRGEILKLGYPDGAQADAAAEASGRLAEAGHGRKRIRRELREVLRHPGRHLGHAVLGTLARLLLGDDTPAPADGHAEAGELRAEPVPHSVWGRDLLDEATLEQFDRACRLPVAVRGAQMPDGHVGYGLPIGGVLATRGAVIPYAVGVDIAGRMRLSIYDEAPELIGRDRRRLQGALMRQTRFGIGAHFEAGERRLHPMLDDPAWREVPILAEHKDKAWSQLGTSGSGNHFAEFGELTCEHGLPELDLAPGRYLALLSHSGSRGLGSDVASFYTDVAMGRCKLPSEARHLAWLPLDTDAGASYWRAMTLCGRYAAANHELIHEHVARSAGLVVRATVENHHNFAWREVHDGEELIVHRKGATPAGAGVLGVIPGSMADPGYVVRGKGNGASLHSAAHGAGRQMSRKKAVATLTRELQEKYLREQGVELIAAGLDESPQAYKRIAQVMRAQADLVEVAAEFMPRLVLMARGGRAED
ncbi:MAG: RtcB family protein [Armatimonadetes bacterium]|nr:RtcB family protein [Armatimonadota bacterium]